LNNHDETKGKEVLADLWDVDFDILNSLEYIESSIKIAIQKCGATLVGTLDKKFIPNGVTVMGLLEESHICLHSYPSKNFAAISCYVCGTADPDIAIDYLIKAFKPKEVIRKQLTRGVRENKTME
jgi:S-adenosylmethionine decarboxylase